MKSRWSGSGPGSVGETRGSANLGDDDQDWKAAIMLCLLFTFLLAQFSMFLSWEIRSCIHTVLTCILHASIHAVPLYAGSQTVSHTHTQIYTKSKTGTHTLTYRTPVHWHLHCVTLTDTVSPDLPHSNIHVLSGCLKLLNPNIWTFNHHWPYIHNLSLHQIYSLLWDL